MAYANWRQDRAKDERIVALYTENVGHPPVNLYEPGSVGYAQWTYTGRGLKGESKSHALHLLTGATGLTEKRARKPRKLAAAPSVKCEHETVNVFTGCCAGCGENVRQMVAA